MIDFMASEADIAAILRDPYSSLISDATYPTEGQPHPRVYGSCTRLLEHFVRETGTLTWEQAVHKLTGAPAAALRLRGKGLLAQGADADVCVFDPEKLHAAFPELAGLTPIALLPMGYPAEGAHPSRLHTDRKPLEELMRYL